MTDRLDPLSEQDKATLRGAATASSSGPEGGLDDPGLVAVLCASVVVGAILAVLAYRCCKKRCRPPKRGKEVVELREETERKHALKTQVSWRLEEGESAEMEDGKTRVVWNFRQAQDMQDMIEKEEAEEASRSAENLLSSDAEEPERSSPGRATRKRLEEMMPAYEDGAGVEYFSVTNSQWIPGSVHLSLLESSDGSPRVGYNVRLPRDKWRHDVPLKRLRLPFRDSEPVELRKWLRGGNSVWHPATVYGPQSASCTIVGYKVELPRPEAEADDPEDPTKIEQVREGPSRGVGSLSAAASTFRQKVKLSLQQSSPAKAGEEAGSEEADPYVLTKVPPSRMRRRFDPGEAVQVFRAPDGGWVDAKVVEKVADKSEGARDESKESVDLGSSPAQSPEPKRAEEDFDSSASPVTAKKGRSVEAWEEAMEDLRDAEENVVEEEKALEEKRQAVAEADHGRETRGLDHREQAELVRFEKNVVAAKAEVAKMRKRLAAAEARLERNLVNCNEIWSVLRVREATATEDCEVPLFLLRGLEHHTANTEIAEI